MKIVYIKGLIKDNYLETLESTVDVHVIEIDYDCPTTELIRLVSNAVRNIKPDFIMGHGTGGWLASWVSLMTGIKFIACNPLMDYKNDNIHYPFQQINGADTGMVLGYGSDIEKHINDYPFYVIETQQNFISAVESFMGISRSGVINNAFEKMKKYSYADIEAGAKYMYIDRDQGGWLSRELIDKQDILNKSYKNKGLSRICLAVSQELSELHTNSVYKLTDLNQLQLIVKY